MKISIIVAKGKQNQIGIMGKLPWKLKDDLKRFRELTLGHSVLMGRKTFESIGKCLPCRTNIVIARNSNLKGNINQFKSVEEGIEFARKNGEEELFIIGGAKIYKYCLEKNLINYIYLTIVDYTGEADVFFPELDYSRWKEEKCGSFNKNSNNEYDFEFLKYSLNIDG